MQQIVVETQRSKQVVDITPRLSDLIDRAGFAEGICYVTVLHTTAAITTADLDPGTDQDMLDAYTGMLPNLRYRHPHDPAHAPDHILAALIGPSVGIPVSGGRRVLGTWQRVVLFEFDGPRRRNVAVTFLPGE